MSVDVFYFVIIPYNLIVWNGRGYPGGPGETIAPLCSAPPFARSGKSKLFHNFAALCELSTRQL